MVAERLPYIGLVEFGEGYSDSELQRAWQLAQTANAVNPARTPKPTPQQLSEGSGPRFDKQFHGTVAYRLIELGFSKKEVFGQKDITISEKT